jgi:micrococcal nuclease
MKVLDRDTVDLQINVGFNLLINQRVRLMGIDPPENRTSDDIEKKYGMQSKRILDMWCSEPTIELRCNDHYGEDEFGRILGELWAKDFNDEWVNINEWMCYQFHAVPYNGDVSK